MASHDREESFQESNGLSFSPSLRVGMSLHGHAGRSPHPRKEKTYTKSWVVKGKAVSGKKEGLTPLKVVLDQDLNRLEVPVREVFKALLAGGNGFVGGLIILDGFDQVVVILL